MMLEHEQTGVIIVIRAWKICKNYTFTFNTRHISATIHTSISLPGTRSDFYTN